MTDAGTENGGFLKWIVHQLDGFTDIGFMVLFFGIAVLIDVHFHEVALHACFGAATFAVVRIGEYREKKHELKEFYKAIPEINFDPELNSKVRSLHKTYQNFFLLFKICYRAALASWFMVATCVAVSMKECTAEMVESGTANFKIHHYFESEYWQFPTGNLWTVSIASAFTAFAFIIAVLLTALCRHYDLQHNASDIVRRLIARSV